MTLLTTVLHESFSPGRFARVPEPDPVMDSTEVVRAFARAGQDRGILSGVYALQVEQACKMIRPGDRVLDLGCGPASLLASVAAVNRDSHFVGVDLSASMIEAGRETVRNLALSNINLRIDDMTRLSTVESGSVDVVLSSMAMHHLPDTGRLHECLCAMERVMAPGARAFVLDFGRIRSPRSVDYFVGRAIPQEETLLRREYRASLRAAFSRDEFRRALPGRLKPRVRVYSTPVCPVIIVLMTPFPAPARAVGRACPSVERLPRDRRADLRKLRLFLRLGGMPTR